MTRAKNELTWNMVSAVTLKVEQSSINWVLTLHHSEPVSTKQRDMQILKSISDGCMMFQM